MGLKRAIGLFTVILTMFGLLAIRLTYLSVPSGQYSQTAATHGSYNVTVNTTRGTIYDRNLNPLVNAKSAYFAVVTPCGNAPLQLASLAPYVDNLATLEQKLTAHLPFVMQVSSPNISGPGITVVTGLSRYGDSLAPQLVGYLDGNGKGAAGIEKVFNGVLADFSRTTTASFPVDASGNKLKGLPAEITTTGNGDTGGVVLTLDKDIQAAAQRAAEKYLVSGSILVMDPTSGDILACASVPGFSQYSLASALNSKDSPLLNKAFAAYNLGSVFKIVMVAAALESGVSPDYSYSCKGNININGQIIKDAETGGHGSEEMAEGFANSCNTYFINLGQHVGAEPIYNMSKSLGLGTASSFTDGLSTAPGNLTKLSVLANSVALANLSIGQGELMVTPVQVARIVSTVVNDGMEPAPHLIKQLVDNNKKTTKTYENSVQDKIFSPSTAQILRQFMIKTVVEGTGTAARPVYGGAGGKTGTAQTGQRIDGKEVDQAWFAGFYPAESPKYVIVAMKENGTSGGANAGPAFKYVADFLASRCGYPSVDQ